MVTFRTEPDRIIATYIREYSNDEWVENSLKTDETCIISKTFTFSKDHLIPRANEEGENLFGEPEPVDFLFAILEGSYYKVLSGVLMHKFDVFIAPDVELSKKFFVAEVNISIFKKIEHLTSEDVYIGGNHPAAISQERFLTMIAAFPSAYERKMYADARVSAVLLDHFATAKDVAPRFNNYLNKRATKKGEDILKLFQDRELVKYQTICEKLTAMLKDENKYNEHQWQTEILQIIRLLYPKYIFAFKSVPIQKRVSADLKSKQLDILLVDCNGNIDVIEIKKPFENAIITSNFYRDNYIPLRELSGTVMQLEKYIYYLNRWGDRGEKYLTEHYKDKLPEGFEIKITNPGGLIIMGREHNLNPAQKKDFEVVKRKYKNVVDIITYDNLLERLRFIIEQIKKL